MWPVVERVPLWVVGIVVLMCWLLTEGHGGPSRHSGPATDGTTSRRGLYIYRGKDITDYIEKLGFRGYRIRSTLDITRNSDGTALRVVDHQTKKVVVLSCDGSAREFEVPSGNVWLNDENRPLAWMSEGRVFYQGRVSDDHSFMADKRADPGGQYFMKSISEGKTSVATAVFSISALDIPLTRIDRFHGERVFSKGDRVFVFGNWFDWREERSEVRVFHAKGAELEQIGNIPIHRPQKSPAPFSLHDMSPWSDDILYCDTYDKPAGCKWYVFDLSTGHMLHVGADAPSGGIGLFLQCDIIPGKGWRYGSS